MSDKLECGHPVACMNTEHEDDQYCEWCNEVDNLKAESKALRDQLHKKAVVVNDGHVAIEGNPDIGLLEVHGGNVDFGGPIQNITIPRYATIGHVVESDTPPKTGGE